MSIRASLGRLYRIVQRLRQARFTRALGRRAVIGNHFVCTNRTAIHNLTSRDRVSVGDFVTLLDTELRCYAGGNIRLGNYIWMSLRGQIVSAARVEIGDYCLFARDVYISDTNEHPLDPQIRRRQTIAYLERGIPPDRLEADCAAVKIGNDVWIGERAVILKGVQLGDGCVVAAASVVTKSFPEHSLIGGNPARLLRSLSVQKELPLG